jgi:large repetitive protein
VNNTAGLPGPGAIVSAESVTAQYCGDETVNRPSEECDGSDDTNCPGACAPNCECATTCGDGTVEFGEQCDPGDPPTTPASDAACPAQCGAVGSPTECTCPAVCGDGFVAPTEQCDPGGVPPGTPASDAACPGQCLPTCACTPAVCGNGTIEPGELCEFPAVNCGPLQLCNITGGCQACVP